MDELLGCNRLEKLRIFKNASGTWNFNSDKYTFVKILTKLFPRGNFKIAETMVNKLKEIKEDFIKVFFSVVEKTKPHVGVLYKIVSKKDQFNVPGSNFTSKP